MADGRDYPLSPRYEWIKVAEGGGHERLEIFPTLGIWRVWQKKGTGPERLFVERDGMSEEFLTLAGEYIAGSMNGGKHHYGPMH